MGLSDVAHIPDLLKNILCVKAQPSFLVSMARNENLADAILISFLIFIKRIRNWMRGDMWKNGMEENQLSHNHLNPVFAHGAGQPADSLFRQSILIISPIMKLQTISQYIC